MSDDSDDFRDALHALIQKEAPSGQDGKILTAWAVVTEWMDGDGDRWLARAYSPGCTQWHARGMWHECLHGSWPGDDE